MNNEIIRKIKEEIKEKNITIDDEIQVLKDKNNIIINYYYKHEEMLKLISHNEWDDNEDLILKRKIAENYDKDLPNLITMKVLDVLVELELKINNNNNNNNNNN